MSKRSASTSSPAEPAPIEFDWAEDGKLAQEFRYIKIGARIRERKKKKKKMMMMMMPTRIWMMMRLGRMQTRSVSTSSSSVEPAPMEFDWDEDGELAQEVLCIQEEACIREKIEARANNNKKKARIMLMGRLGRMSRRSASTSSSVEPTLGSTTMEFDWDENDEEFDWDEDRIEAPEKHDTFI